MTTSHPAARAYVDTPVTDLEGARRAALDAAAAFSLPAPTLIRVGMNAIYAAGDTVLRVAHPTVDASASLALAAFWAERGVRCPVPARRDVVRSDGFAVTAWERIEESGAPIEWEAVGAMVRTIHRAHADAVPTGVPLPSPSTFPWWDFDALLARTAPLLDDAARAGLVATVDRHRGWERFTESVVCHGDVHPGNVMQSTDGPVLIDWDLLCAAPPGWDHGPLLTWASRWGGRPGEYEAFATGYGRSLADDPETVAFAELRLVAATLMRVGAGEHDARAHAEAERRLRYWRGDPDAPPWSAQ